MNRQRVFTLIGFVACSLAGPALAFRSCPGADSDQLGAATQYMVGELSFDADTGLAGGTQTTYNYTSTTGEGGSECHVTYELAGNFLIRVCRSCSDSRKRAAQRSIRGCFKHDWH